MKLKVQNNDLVEIALKIGETKNHRKYRFDYAYIIFNGLFQIESLELHYSDAIDGWKFTIPFSEISNDFKCSTCRSCDLYENKNTQHSNIHFCKITDDFITDIEQDFCTKYKQE